MKLNSSKVTKAEIFYRFMEIVFAAAILYTTLGRWISQAIYHTDSPGTPGAVVFLFVFGWVVMILLGSAERSHRRSVKWYNHGPEPVLAK